MTSNINPLNIDGNYPVAGVPNNTQGFRDNFSATQTNFQYAADEITELQNLSVLKQGFGNTIPDNNMNDNLIYAVELSDVGYPEVQLAQTSGSITLDYSAGMYQVVPSASGSISLGFSNWPTSGVVGSLNFAIVVTNTAYTLTLPSSVSAGIARIDGASPGTAGVTNVITFAATGTYVYKFETANGGTTISIENTIRPSNTYSAPIIITNTTTSTSKTTGALVVAGGVGFSGNLNVGGNLTTYTSTGNIAFQALDTGVVQFRTPTAIAANTAGAFNIVGSTTGTYQPVTNAGGMIHITGNQGVASRITNDAFGTSANPVYVGRMARGTVDSPTVPQANDVLSRFVGVGWNGAGGYGPTAGGTAPCGMDFVATETYSGTAQGSAIQFYNAPTGSNVRTLSATVASTGITVPGIVSVTGNVIGGNITTAGLITATGNITGGNITTAGNIWLADGGTMGYNTGAGGTVAQGGNKSTGVTLNKPSGEITMQSTNLGADTTVSFTLTNSTIGARDLLLMNIVGGVATPGTYNLDANCTTGSAVISVRNITGGTLGEAIVIRYAVIRGSIA